MKEKLYNIMEDLNEILKDIDALVDVVGIHFDGIVEGYTSDKARSVLNVQLSVLKAIQKDTEDLYNKIDQTILDMKYGAYISTQKRK